MIALEKLIVPFFTFILFITILRKRTSKTRKNLPPSPIKLPIIGNLHQLGKVPHRTLQSLSKHYGPLMLLHLGRMPVLHVSSANAACEVMKNQDANFSNRPISSMQHRLTYGSRDVAFRPLGDYWKQVRSISVVHLLSPKMVKSIRRVREEETTAMVDKIRRLGFSSSVVNLTDVLLTLTGDVFCRVAFGRTYNDEEDKSFKKFVGEFAVLVGSPSLRDYFPWIGWIDRISGLDARVEKIIKQFDEFMAVVLQEHRKREKVIGGDKESDFVDILLKFQKENKITSPVEDETIKAILLDMYSGFTHTAMTVVEWAIVELIKDSRAMKILQNELRQVTGGKKEIDEDDLEKTPYLKAVIKESLRLHSPIALIARECTQDTKVMGYDIPSGTRVFINAWAIARDPSIWENPEDFYPERFLDSRVDYKGLHFELIPFGAGRRGCPAIGFSVAINEIGLAKLVHNFNFALPNGGKAEDLDISESTGLTAHKKFPLLVEATPINT